MSIPFYSDKRALPAGFVYVQDSIPDIVLELRYASDHNFVGMRIDGYMAPRLILTEEATRALKEVQQELRQSGLSLMVFDGYRPQRAVDQFVRWSKDLSDTRKKSEYYPHVAKQDLIKEGYIACKSSHTRGSTVDLSIVSFRKGDAGKPLDMGGSFDYFDPCSWSEYIQLETHQLENRKFLQTLMRNYGFVPYPQEWWHFTLRDEPFSDQYFDFPIE